MSNRDAECLLPQPGGFGRSLAHEIEVQLVDPPILGAVVSHLAGDAVELTAAAQDHEVVGASIEVTPHPHVAEAADLAVEVNERVALGLVPIGIEPALDVIATDLVLAVMRVEEFFLEPERVLAHSVA